ncbi:MAG: ectonucleotide pyrophosphatase/phosphodiesterase [Bacteriovoracaceae bacterium]
MRIALFLLSLFVFVSCQTPRSNTSTENAPEHLNKPYVVMVSIDGYRYDYTDKYKPKALGELMQKGLSAKGMLSIYPTKTFPNHYSIATGLYSAHHGLVANEFYDRDRNVRYKISDRVQVGDPVWYKGTPLWNATQDEGMLSASYFWVGTDAPIGGKHPTYFFPYDQSVSNESRVDQVIAWLELPEKKRPHFITLYFSDVDSAGHSFGPDSDEVRDAVHSVDKMIERLRAGIAKTKLPVNLIVVSDHGMQKIGDHIYMTDYMSLDGLRIEGRGPHALVYVEDEARRTSVRAELEKIPHIKVRTPEEMPKEYGYSNNKLLGDYILMVKPPYYLEPKKDLMAQMSKRAGGTHGYDIRESKDMQAIFYAEGPNIKAVQGIAPFENINVYPFVLKLLGLPQKAKIDGDIKVLGPYLK